MKIDVVIEMMHSTLLIMRNLTFKLWEAIKDHLFIVGMSNGAWGKNDTGLM